MSFFGQSSLNDNYIELIIMTLYPKLILDALSTVPYPDSDPHCGVEEVIRIRNRSSETASNGGFGTLFLFVSKSPLKKLQV